MTRALEFFIRCWRDKLAALILFVGGCIIFASGLVMIYGWVVIGYAVVGG